MVQDRAHLAPQEMVASVLASDEFRLEVLGRFLRSGSVAPGRFERAPGLAQRYWAADHLPIADATGADLARAGSGLDLLALLAADRDFLRASGQ